MQNAFIAPAIKEYCLDSTTNWNLSGNSVGARDFSPDWKHRYFGTEVPCLDKVSPQIPIYCAEGGFFQNVADVSIAYQIFGPRVLKMSAITFFSCTSHRKYGMLPNVRRGNSHLSPRTRDMKLADNTHETAPGKQDCAPMNRPPGREAV